MRQNPLHLHRKARLRRLTTRRRPIYYISALLDAYFDSDDFTTFLRSSRFHRLAAGTAVITNTALHYNTRIAAGPTPSRPIPPRTQKIEKRLTSHRYSSAPTTCTRRMSTLQPRDVLYRIELLVSTLIDSLHNPTSTVPALHALPSHIAPQAQASSSLGSNSSWSSSSSSSPQPQPLPLPLPSASA